MIRCARARRYAKTPQASLTFGCHLRDYWTATIPSDSIFGSGYEGRTHKTRRQRIDREQSDLLAVTAKALEGRIAVVNRRGYVLHSG